ncbi:XkdX family protein [Salibacterium sp. K-3]
MYYESVKEGYSVDRVRRSVEGGVITESEYEGITGEAYPTSS